MAVVQKEMCSSCFRETGYRCILCANPFCNQCSVFEENEDVPGWVMGKSVAYCEHCFEEKWTTTNRATTNDDNITDHRSSCDDKSKTDATSSSSSSSKRSWSDSEDSIVDVEADQQEVEDGGYEAAVAMFSKKGKKKKKPGRKTNWSAAAVNDLIDIVVNNDAYKRKLIFVNTKNQKNGEIYKAILQELKHRASKRGENVNFTVDQLRTKFKRCISLCKKAALTIKTSTGIKRFQDEKELGQWFDQLYPIVKTRDSCNPESAVEPSSSDGGDRSMHDTTTSPGDDDEINTGPGTKVCSH